MSYMAISEIMIQTICSEAPRYCHPKFRGFVQKLSMASKF